MQLQVFRSYISYRSEQRNVLSFEVNIKVIAQQHNIFSCNILCKIMCGHSVDPSVEILGAPQRLLRLSLFRRVKNDFSNDLRWYETRHSIETDNSKEQ